MYLKYGLKKMEGVRALLVAETVDDSKATVFGNYTNAFLEKFNERSKFGSLSRGHDSFCLCRLNKVQTEGTCTPNGGVEV